MRSKALLSLAVTAGLALPAGEATPAPAPPGPPPHARETTLTVH